MSLYEAAKTVLEQSPSDSLDLRKAIMDLMDLALRSDEEITTLKRRVTDLEQAADISHSLDLDQGVYWQPGEGGLRKGPFCPACWGADRKLVPMQLSETAQQGDWWALCPIHKISSFIVRIKRRLPGLQDPW